MPAMRSDTALGKFWFSVGDLCGKMRECVTMVVCVYLRKLDSVCVYTHVLSRRRQNNADVGDLKKKMGGEQRCLRQE